jgi:uncharacterized protein
MDGNGVLQDYVLAHMWLNLAAAQGDKDAAKQRDELAAKELRGKLGDGMRRAA